MGKLTFGQTGLSYEADKVEIKVEGAPKCPRCDQRVYFNEEKKASGKSYHTKCFACYRCKKSLSSTNYNHYNDELLCAICYKKTESMKPSGGYATGYVGLNPSVTPTDRFESEIWNENGSKRSSGSQEYLVEVDRGDAKSGYTETWLNTNSGGSAYSSPSQGSREDLRTDTIRSVGSQRASEPLAASSRTYSSTNDPTNFLFTQGFTLNESSSPSGDTSPFQNGSRNSSVFDNPLNPMRRELGAKASAKFRHSSEHNTIDKDNLENCPRCGRRVYFAEEIKVLKRKYHKLCFKCQSCTKTLEPGKFTEHDSQLYCQNCYAKNFGPYGYGTIGGVRGVSTSGSCYVDVESQLMPGSRTSISSPYELNSINRKQHYKPGVSELCGEARTLEVREPIRGTQEWTEAISFK